MRRRSSLAFVCVAALMAAGAVPVLAKTAKSSARHASGTIGDPRFNGFWNVDADFRADTSYQTHAVLAPAGQAIAAQNRERQRERLAHGEVVGLGGYTCGISGVPTVYNTSEPWLLVVTPDEVSQIMERRQMPARRFYMDGRNWPDPATAPRSVNGLSIGHWEGKDLVVETRDMPSGGTQAGGLKGPKTVLTERLSLSADGQHLMWQYTWTDPDLLAKPLVYTLKYDRAPPHTFAYTHPCDPNEDSARTVSAPGQD